METADEQLSETDRRWARAAAVGHLSDDATDVCFCKIVPFEEQGFARAARQRVSEDVAEIETGGVASLAEAAVRASRLRHMIRVDRDDD